MSIGKLRKLKAKSTASIHATAQLLDLVLQQLFHLTWAGRTSETKSPSFGAILAFSVGTVKLAEA